MGRPHVISQLTKRYARLLGEYKSAERQSETALTLAEMDEAYYQIGKIQEDRRRKMGQIAGALLQFDPDFAICRIKAAKPQPAKRKVYALHIYSILQTSDAPMKTRDIAKIVAARLGLTGESNIAIIEARVYGLLMPKVDRTIRLDTEGPMRWSLINRDQVRPKLTNTKDHVNQSPQARGPKRPSKYSR